LFWNRYRRATAGVLTSVGGFTLWGAVFPASVLLQVLAPSVKVESEVWNIPKYLVAVGMILTLLEDQIEKSRYLAYHDELTGLPNRRLMDDRLDQAIAHADRTGSKVAVLLLDLDRFKEVNDDFGHRVGDLALQEVVSRLAGRIRASDTLARSGGDEFTLVSYVADADGARALVSSLEAALSTPIWVDGRQVQTGLSVGLALYPDDSRNPDQLHATADRAMYAAKRASREAALNSIQPAITSNPRLTISQQRAQ
jgi:diguanylate cyclase (GGDEF)-like protein